jgi:hypothetical protein
VHRSGSNSVKGDRETSTKLEPLLAGLLITETPKLQAVSANTSAGDKFLHLGLKDQTTKFAEQVLPFHQRHAHLICCKPRDPPIEPANLDRARFFGSNPSPLARKAVLGRDQPPPRPPGMRQVAPRHLMDAKAIDEDVDEA